MIVKQFYAWMCLDKNGNEFPVMAAHQENPALPFPLGGFDEHMAMLHKPLAMEIAKASGNQLTLVRYEGRRCVLNLYPPGVARPEPKKGEPDAKQG